MERFRQTRSGRPSLLTKDDEKEIKRLIEENDPKKYRINASSYTTKELQLYFIKYRGKFIDEETFRVHLVKIGAHYVKAQLRYKEGDENRQIFSTLKSTTASGKEKDRSANQ